MPPTRPDILFIMTDQQRFDTIAALGNSHIYTPNLDRLVRRGTSFSNVYTTCPICIPARYTIAGEVPPQLLAVRSPIFAKEIESSSWVGMTSVLIICRVSPQPAISLLLIPLPTHRFLRG
jgi:Sulfatase